MNAFDSENLANSLVHKYAIKIVNKDPMSETKKVLRIWYLLWITSNTDNMIILNHNTAYEKADNYPDFEVVGVKYTIKYDSAKVISK